MTRSKQPPVIPRQVAALATRQFGVVGRAQLVALGMSTDAVDWRLRRQWLRRVLPGVYALGHDHLDFRGRGRAALLWAGSDALLSHSTAAILWDLLPEDDGPIHVTRGRGRRAPTGVVVHGVRAQPRCQTRRGLPVTTAARTLLDVPSRRLLGQALYDKRTSIPQLRKELQTSPGHPNARALGRLIQTASATRSHLEDRFLALITEAGLPRPATNVRVAGFKVDAVWHDRRLVVEIDTWHSHGDHLAFGDDHHRDAALMRAGYTVIRFTDVQLADESHAVIATLAAALYSAASSHQ